MRHYKFIGDTLKKHMREMTPAELARITGVPAMTIGRIIHGQTRPQIDTLERIAQGIKVPLPALVCDDPELRQLIIDLANKTPDERQALKTLLKI